MKKVILLLLLFLTHQLLGQGYICAVGGGPEDYNDWSDKPYSWIVEKSNKGKIVILSVNDETEWIPNYFKSFGASSAVNLKIDTRIAANLQQTYDEIISAKAIFIKGGDQSKYILNWQNTKVIDAIKFVFNNGGVVSGTSAGAMVLGNLVFTAEKSSASPKESLKNPFYSGITLNDNFLGLLPNLIIDTHVAERGRIGRLIPFLFNYWANTGKDFLGVGIDDMTALCVEKNGIAVVFGTGAVSFFHKDEKSKYQNSTEGYLIENLRCDQLVEGWQYDLQNKKIFSVPASAKIVTGFQKNNLPKTNFTVTGSDNAVPFLKALDNFVKLNNLTRLFLFTDAEAQETMKEVKSYLATNNIGSNIFLISQSNLSNAVSAEEIRNAEAFVFLASNLNIRNLLNDSTSLSGGVLRQKLNSGTPICGIGNNGKIFCGNYIDYTDTNIYASYYGMMTNNTGLGLFDGLVFQPNIFSSSDYVENRFSALLWGMMRNRKPFGLFLDDDSFANVFAEAGFLTVSGSFPLFIVDASETTVIDSSKYKASKGRSTRQIVAMDNLRFTISNKYMSYSFSNKCVMLSTKVINSEDPQINFNLNNNFPNPFNGSTIISFSLKVPSPTKLNVYDILGGRIDKLVDGSLSAGNYSITYSPSESVSSGVYFLSLITPTQTQTKKMVYLR
jgi:cyanophycinase